MSKRTVISVMMNNRPVDIYATDSIPLKVAVDYDSMQRGYGGDPPLEMLVDFFKKCLVNPDDADLVDNLTSRDFQDVVAEWTVKSDAS